MGIRARVSRLRVFRHCEFGRDFKLRRRLGLAPGNPFRFFKVQKSFALHEAAFASVRGDRVALSNLVLRTERVLNDPDCRDASTPDRCAATAGRRFQQSRMGWAAQTLGNTCYERDGRPRRYPAVCERTFHGAG